MAGIIVIALVIIALFIVETSILEYPWNIYYPANVPDKEEACPAANNPTAHIYLPFLPKTDSRL